MLVLAVMTLSPACTNEKNISSTPNNGDVFIYKRRGPTVAPEYRRDYTIRVEPAEVYFAIDSYDEILYRDSAKLSAIAYTGFVQSLTALQIAKKEYKPGSFMCTGGVSDNLTLYAGSSKEIDGFIYYCAGEKHGSLQGDVAAAAALFKALIPNLEKKIEATEKD